ncbi:lysozyme inhibitor LprI family protein [Azorhizobium sp. AG788]|uniref:lysozyme inhibitor LprI family protein n=1 Tax=Azorhizobium sp. AG788 TaxID=2183897 RepID=UPI00313924D8
MLRPAPVSPAPDPTSRLRPHGRMAMVALALAGAGLWLAALPAAAAGEGPSFDCKAARSKPEKAICADPALAALDRKMAAAYRKAMAGLDASGKNALRADQRLFLEARDIQMTQAKPQDYDLKADMQSRVTLLEGIETAPRPGWAGTWSNASGEIRIKPSPGGTFEVSISTVQPYPSYPVCDLTTAGRPEGAALVVGGSATERKVNDGWSITLTRKGTVLDAELVRPPGEESGSPPFCGFRASIDGTFLPVTPAQAKRAP